MEIMSDEKLKVENVRLLAVNSPLKKGYKQTDVGLIPMEWNVKTFAEIFKFLATGTNSRSDLSEYGDIKYVHYGDIHKKWFVFLDCTTDSIPLIDKSKVAALPMLYDGDLIMADASEDEAGIGISVEVKHTKNQKVVAGLHTFLLRGDKALVVDGFKAYIQSIKTVKNSLRKIATGVSVYGISKNNLKQIFVTLPTLPEQHAIAEVLIDVDALIKGLDMLITKKINIKQGAMQQLLTGKKRLLGFTKKWEVKKLGEVFIISAGADFIPELSSGMKDDKYPYPIYSNAVSDKGLYGYSSYYAYNENSITVTARGTLGYANVRDHKFTAIGRVLVLMPKCSVSCFFVSKYINNNIEFVIESTGVPQLTAPQISKYEILYPPLPEQEAIAKILSNMDAEIEHLEQERDKIKLIKQGMMQELLTGKTRLI